MKHLIKIYILLTIVLAGTSCEGFLEKYPSTGIPPKITTADEALQVDYGIYSAFKNTALYSGDMLLAQDIQADLFYAFEGFTNAFGAIYRWDIPTTNAEVQNVYAGLYLIVSRANFLLDNAEGLLANAEALKDPAAKKNAIETIKKCLGDAHFARALCFSELLRIYAKAYPASGDMGDDELAKDVTTYPGISLVLHYGKQTQAPLRASLYDSYEQVLRDLEKAEEYLKLRNYAADNPYFTTGAVHTLFSRVYLHMRRWDKAAEYASKVIDSKVYELANATLFSYTSQFDDYRFMWLYDSHPEIIWKVACSYVDPVGAMGMSFLNFDYQSAYQPNYAPLKWVEDLYSFPDLRYRAFFRESSPTMYGFPATLLNKYAGNPEFDGQAGRLLYMNAPKPLRLSEVYLIRAEAYYYLKKEDLANKDLTTLRRSRINAYGSAALRGTELRDDIRDERVRELLMEGFRLSDLKRYGQGFTRKPQTGSTNGPDRLKIESNNPQFVWPIPQHEMDAVPGMQGNASNK